jgi:hypothetical protein
MNRFTGDFDAVVFDAAVDLLELRDVQSSSLPRDELAIAQLYHAVSQGGFGLRRAADTSSFAFLSAHVAAIREEAAIWQDISNRYPSSYRRLHAAVTVCMDVVRERVTTGYDDADAREFNLRQRTLLDTMLSRQSHSLSSSSLQHSQSEFREP